MKTLGQSALRQFLSSEMERLYLQEPALGFECEKHSNSDERLSPETQARGATPASPQSCWEPVNAQAMR